MCGLLCWVGTDAVAGVSRAHRQILSVLCRLYVCMCDGQLDGDEGSDEEEEEPEQPLAKKARRR